MAALILQIFLLFLHSHVLQTSEDVGQLLHQGLVTVGDPDVRNVGPGHVISGNPVSGDVRTEPVLLHLLNFYVELKV